jgi:hypothetical protein
MITPTVTAPTDTDLPLGAIGVLRERLKNRPRGLDPKLPLDHPNQTVMDCRTIRGWMKTMGVLLAQIHEGESYRFSHDYALVGNPNNLADTYVVWEVMSKAPAMVSKSGTRQIKPTVQETLSRQATAPIATATGAIPQASQQGAELIYAQSFDVMMMFSIYSSTWERLYDDVEAFEDFMVSYAGVFIETGLQQLYFCEQTRDALFDPPKVEEFPNKTLFYKARIEKQTRVPVAVIEQVLIKAGLIDPLTNESSTTQIVGAPVSGIPASPILPA